MPELDDDSGVLFDPDNPPRAIGPYRLDERLDAGGMGEIWAGYDERLDRPLALKRMHSELGGHAGARERFRREARAVARLRHPAIVQVYDWIEDASGDWIVMERVLGYSLRERLAVGPLPTRRALEVARDVAAVLRVAHAAGIIHRDLKAENVMLTGDGEVRVLDFGLAKSKASSDGTPLSSLSAEGQILGTLTTMAPEQAMGHTVDARADLFSLGILLYEMLTAARPFAGANAVETLARLCTAHEEPVHQRDSNIPPEVSRLVGRLLEKEPARRPQNAAEVVDTLTAILARHGEHSSADPSPPDPRLEQRGDDAEIPIEHRPTLFAPSSDAWRFSEPPSDVPAATARKANRVAWIGAVLAIVVTVVVGIVFGVRSRAPQTNIPGAASQPGVSQPDKSMLLVAVMPTRILGDAPGEQEAASHRLQAGAIRAGVERALLAVDGARVIPTTAGAESPAHLARAVGAEEAFLSQLDCASSFCQVFLQRIRGQDGVLLWSDRFTPATANPLDLSLTVSDRVLGAYAEHGQNGEAPAPPVSQEDFTAFLALTDAERRRGDGFSDAAFLADLEAIQKSSPRFLEAPLFEAFFLRKAFAETRRREDAERALAALTRARALKPEDPRTLKAFVQLLQDLGRDEEASSILATLERLDPGDADVLYHRARALEKAGRRDEALELMREAVRRQPSWNHFSNLADMSYRAGDLNGARAGLEAMLERTPDTFGGRSRLAQLELLSGSPQRAAELYEKLVAQRPGEAELSNLGVARLLLGQADAAAEAFRRALDKAPGSPYAMLNLADAELLRGAEPTAFMLYAETLTAIAQDPNPDALATIRAQALAHLGRVEEAVGDVQRAVRRAPDNPQVAYEAALVYALVGEETSALLEARRALDGGVDRRWFAFAWFDALRDRL